MPRLFRIAPWLLLVAGLSIAVLPGCGGKKKSNDGDNNDDSSGRSRTSALGPIIAKGKDNDGPFFKKEVEANDEDPEVLAYFTKRGWKLERKRDWVNGKNFIKLTVETKENSITDDDAKMIGKSKATQLLSIMYVKNCSAAQLKLATAAPNLESIDLNNMDLTDAAMKELAQVKGLKSISLVKADKVTDAGIKELAGLPNLQTLELSFMEFSGSCFEAFANVKTLEHLTVEFTDKLTDDGLKNIGKIPNLHELKILTVNGYNGVTSAGIKAIVDQPRIPEKFRFDNKLLDDELLIALVKKGWIYGPDVPGNDLPKPATADQVHFIILENSKITDKGFDAILGCVNVELINLRSTGISDESLKKLRTFKKLNSLSLSETKVTAVGLEAITACPITNLELNGVELTEDSFKAIAKMGGLEGLSIQDTKMKSESLKHLTGLTKLTALNLQHTDCDDAAAKKLAEITKLENINLSGTKVGDVGFQELLKLPKLSGIFIADTKVTKEVIEKAKKDHPNIFIRS